MYLLHGQVPLTCGGDDTGVCAMKKEFPNMFYMQLTCSICIC